MLSLRDLTFDATAWGFGWVSWTVRLWISKALLPHSDTISPKARLTGINLLCRNHILLEINQWAKLSYIFLQETDGSRGGEKSPLWFGTGLGTGRFRHIKSRGTRDCYGRGGPTVALPESELWESSGRVPLIWDAYLAVLQVGQAEWVARQFLLLLLVLSPHLAWVWGSEAKIKMNTNNPERAQDSASGEVGSKPTQSLTSCGILERVGPQFAHL